MNFITTSSQMFMPSGASFLNFPPPPLGIPPTNWTLDTSVPPPWNVPNQHSSSSYMVNKKESEYDSDKKWIKSWMRKFSSESLPGSKFSVKAVKTSVKVSEFKGLLQKFAFGLIELEGMYSSLQVLKKTLNDKEWLERCREVGEKKDVLKEVLQEIFCKSKFAEKNIKLRKNKRLQEKKRRKNFQARKREVLEHRDREHKRIDMWLEKMKEAAERAKREDNVKAEADAVLSNVTRKKSEAKRTLALLSTLSKLRSARVHALIARGGNCSQNEIDTFIQIVDRLRKYWIDQLKEYNIEEQGLQVMLNDAEVERSDIDLSIRKQILQEWNQVIFGLKSETVSKYEPLSMEDLISVRFSWDAYSCSEPVLMATNIPSGWVIPSGPSNEDWAYFLKP